MPSFSDRRGIGHFFGAMVGRLIERWREWTAPDRYRPEKHYMRGPGPKNLGPKNLGSKNLEPKNAGRAGGGNSDAA